MRYRSNAVDDYSPMLFLSALGAGGIAVSFFMYLTWLTPHSGTPVPTFDSLMAYWPTATPLMQAIVATATLGLAVFSLIHIRTLVWNIRQYLRWSKTPAYKKLRESNSETQLMALPLTYAMSINVAFLVGAVFVPGLWAYVEYLFPLAMVAFGIVGIYGARIFLDFYTRNVVHGHFNCAKNNSFSQMVTVFAFGMVGVGFAAPAAMSHNPVTSAIAIMLSQLFIVAAVLLGAIKLILGYRAMFEHAAERETVPTLWIMIPITTVIGLALYRINSALHHNFGVEWQAGETFTFLSVLFSVQLVFGVIGYSVMKRFDYFEHFVSGKAKSPGAFALICPGVAIFVFANFVINAGLVHLGIVPKFSIAYALLYLPLIYVQFITIRTYFRLNKKMLRAESGKPAGADGVAVPAE